LDVDTTKILWPFVEVVESTLFHLVDSLVLHMMNVVKHNSINGPDGGKLHTLLAYIATFSIDDGTN
jgi:hypothetical protein